MADLSPLEQWRVIVLKLFPWIARVGIAPSGALGIKSAVGRIELEGGGPAVARVGDAIEGGWLLFDPGIPTTTPPNLYYSSTSAQGPFAPVAQVLVPGTPPPAGLYPPGGTHIIGDITSGSAKVTCG